MGYTLIMKNVLNKLMVPMIILFAINLVGFLFYKNYEGAVVGSVVGMLVGFLALEIRTKDE
jgi:putative effector of murein hydrolase LrgA (UPF0299 family)